MIKNVGISRGYDGARGSNEQDEVASLAARLEMHLAILKERPAPQYAKVIRELEQALSEIDPGYGFSTDLRGSRCSSTASRARTPA